MLNNLPAHTNANDFEREVDIFVSQVNSLQRAYKAANGSYFQGLPFPVAVPSIGDNKIPFAQISQPTDQAASWNDFGIPRMNYRGQYSIEVYNGPSGQGYVVVARIQYPNVTGYYEKRVNVGDESSMDTNGWVLVVEEP